MMREILFRGRTTQGKEWISGYYAKYSELHFIWGRNSFGTMLMFEVDPETVGQFTGLIDKNGKKIFEGDIVRYELYKPYYDRFTVMEDSVKFGSGQFFPRPHINACEDDYYSEEERNFEVIGNIHDNRELLEGERQ